MHLSFFAFQSKLTKRAITLVFVGGFIWALYVNFSPLSLRRWDGAKISIHPVSKLLVLGRIARKIMLFCYYLFVVLLKQSKIRNNQVNITVNKQIQSCPSIVCKQISTYESGRLQYSLHQIPDVHVRLWLINCFQLIIDQNVTDSD